MKYYVILLVTYNNGTEDKVAIYKQTDEDSCLKAFYQYMSQYVNADGVATVNVETKNNLGGVYKNETWSKKDEPIAEVPTEEISTEEVTE